MKILLLCNKSPWPLHEGGPIAMYAIISGLLKAGHQVKVLAANTNKYFIDPGSLPQEFSQATSIEFAYIDLSIHPLDALKNFILRTSYHVSRFRNRDFENKLMRILQNEEFDIVQCEMLYTTVYLDTIRRYSKAKIVLRAHNVEHLIWQRIAGNSRNPIKKYYLDHLFTTLKKYELGILDKVDGIAAITSTDADFFRQVAGRTPLVSIPFGIDPDKYPDPDSHEKGTGLFHIGSMNWLPNSEGIQWFLKEVWPEVRETFPALILYLAGRMMPEWLLSSNIEGVVINGEVPDAINFMKEHRVMIVPLFSGSGIRIKIIEAMTAGKVVISTSIGAEGIEYENRKHLLIADTRAQFVKAITEITENEDLADSIASNARKLMLGKYDNTAIIGRLTGFYESLLRGG
jgi:polysaccharide biosynthesis protein PslH